jgi:membrane associated rhomboid family serine protease
MSQRLSPGGSQGYVVEGLGGRAGRLFTPTVTVLLVLSLAGFLGPLLLPAPAAMGLLRTFGLSLGAAVGGLRVWQFGTHALLHAGCGAAWSFVMTALFLLFFGSRLERSWGTMRFACFCGAAIAAAGIVRALAEVGSGTVVFGSLGLISGMLAAYGVTFRGERIWAFRTTISVVHFVIGLLVILLLLNLSPLANALWLAGAPVGWAYTRAAYRWEARRTPKPAATDRFAGIDLGE